MQEIFTDNIRKILSTRKTGVFPPDISSIAQQATAALNNLHVGVTMQAGGSTITTQAQVDVPGT